ncbi:MAG: DNA alkylation repair protein [Acidimicrobiales bacterium]
MSALRDELVARLEAVADPGRASGQQDYMKSEMPFHGVAMPDVRRITASLARDFPFADRANWEATVLEVWRHATHREQMYVATQLAAHRPYRRWLDGGCLPMIEEMIVTGAWWDHVDALASDHMGAMLASDPDTVHPVMWQWATDDLERDGAMWRRRTSIICQLSFKDDTDLDLLFHAIEASMDSKEFFLRKAIGWALRQYARTDADEVIAFVDRFEDRLSGLSKREALKHLHSGK